MLCKHCGLQIEQALTNGNELWWVHSGDGLRRCWLEAEPDAALRAQVERVERQRRLRREARFSLRGVDVCWAFLWKHGEEQVIVERSVVSPDQAMELSVALQMACAWIEEQRKKSCKEPHA